MSESGCLKDGDFNNLTVRNLDITAIQHLSLVQDLRTETNLVVGGNTGTATLDVSTNSHLVGTLAVGPNTFGTNTTFTVAASGDTAVGGTLEVTGATTLSTLGVGAITGTGALAVAGAVTGVTDLTMGGALAVGGPVSGVTTLAASDTVTASGAVTVGGPLGVTGATTLNGLLHMPGPTDAGISPTGSGGSGSEHVVPTETIVTSVTSTGGSASAVTLAAGTAGQIKIVYLATMASGDTTVITPAALIDATTITLSAVGHSATLYYTGGTYGWLCLSVRGAALA
jgi:hypothetical protein